MKRFILQAVAIVCAVVSSVAPAAEPSEIKGNFDEVTVLKEAKASHDARQGKLNYWNREFRSGWDEKMSKIFTEFGHGYISNEPFEGNSIIPEDWGQKKDPIPAWKVARHFKIECSYQTRLLETLDEETFVFFKDCVQIESGGEFVGKGLYCLHLFAVFTNKIEAKEDVVELIYNLAANTPSLKGVSSGSLELRHSLPIEDFLVGADFAVKEDDKDRFAGKLEGFKPESFKYAYLIAFEDIESQTSLKGLRWYVRVPSLVPGKLFMILEK